MRLKTLPLLLGTLICVLTFAFAASGFGHRFASASETGARAYAAAFGLNAADLCGGDAEESGDTGCQACRLLASFHLPSPETGFVRLALTPGEAMPQTAGRRLSSLTCDAARPARAPPLA